MKNIKLVATDLDGTFLKDDRTISNRNLESLHSLGDNDIIRVAATGRNLKKVEQVINGHVPFDYIVFSSGAGVFDWKNKKHIFNQNIDKETSTDLLKYFVGRNMNFHAFYPVPDNHQHWYFRGEKDCDEFERYFSFNQANAIEFKEAFSPDEGLSQLLIIIPEVEAQFESLKRDIEGISSDIRVIRSSSPITKGYIWIEVFQNRVSKGNGVKFICDSLGINYDTTLGIGNDYNDFDLLDFTRHSFITENAPKAILNRYKAAPSNENDAFAFVTQPLLK